MSRIKLWILLLGCIGFAIADLFVLTTKGGTPNGDLVLGGLFIFLGGALVAAMRLLELSLQSLPTIDFARKTIVVHRSRLKLLLHVAMFSLWTVGLFFIVFAADTSDLRLGVLFKVGAPILLLVSVVPLPLLLRRVLKKDIGIVIDRDGIQDHLTEYGQIAWRDISEAEIEDVRPKQKIVLQMRQPAKYQKSWTQKIIERLLAPKRRTSIALDMAGINGKPDFLLATIQSRVRAAMRMQ